MKYLDVKNVSYGLIPFGPANGQVAISITLESTDEETAAYPKFKEIVNNLNLGDEFVRAIDGSQSVFFVFEGQAIMDPDCLDSWDKFFTELSRDSISAQKTLSVQNMRPPFCVYQTVPDRLCRTQKGATVFEYFNTCYAVLDCSTEFHEMGMQQLVSTRFSCVCLKSSDNDETERYISEKLSKYDLTRKLYIIGDTPETAQFCMKKRYRFNYLSGLDEDLF